MRIKSPLAKARRNIQRWLGGIPHFFSPVRHLPQPPASGRIVRPLPGLCATGLTQVYGTRAALRACGKARARPRTQKLWAFSIAHMDCGGRFLPPAVEENRETSELARQSRSSSGGEAAGAVRVHRVLICGDQGRAARPCHVPGAVKTSAPKPWVVRGSGWTYTPRSAADPRHDGGSGRPPSKTRLVARRGVPSPHRHPRGCMAPPPAVAAGRAGERLQAERSGIHPVPSGLIAQQVPRETRLRPRQAARFP